MVTIRKLHGGGPGEIAAAGPWNCICALALTVLLAPLILSVCLLVKAGGGPVLVRQVHLRRDGTAVHTWRFRTWQVRATPPGDRTRGYGGDVPAGMPWVTAVGRFLRRTRIDTLPLLYSVAKGELTLSEMVQDT